MLEPLLTNKVQFYIVSLSNSWKFKLNLKISLFYSCDCFSLLRLASW